MESQLPSDVCLLAWRSLLCTAAAEEKTVLLLRQDYKKGINIKLRSWYLDSSYFNHKHSSSQYMAGVVAPKLNPSHLLNLMEVNGLNLIHALFQIRLSVQHVISRNIAIIKQSLNY